MSKKACLVGINIPKKKRTKQEESYAFQMWDTEKEIDSLEIFDWRTASEGMLRKNKYIIS